MIEAPRIFLGGSGKLGHAFLKQFPDYTAPTHRDLDITDQRRVYEYIHDMRPACIIHSAAVVGRNEAERDRMHTYRVNVLGTENVTKACQDGTRLVYISSVAIFDGKKGLYREDDIPNPLYYYGWTKLLGEQTVKMLQDYVIIRTDFFNPANFKYRAALTDHYCSRIPITTLTVILNRIAESNYRGVINVGAERDTLYNILKKLIPDIQGITTAESSMPDFPHDLSLDLSLYKKLFPEAEYQNGK